jgi:hypothetical protein
MLGIPGFKSGSKSYPFFFIAEEIQIVQRLAKGKKIKSQYDHENNADLYQDRKENQVL